MKEAMARFALQEAPWENFADTWPWTQNRVQQCQRCDNGKALRRPVFIGKDEIGVVGRQKEQTF